MTAAQPLHTVLGSGPAGTALARELVRRGHPVRLVDRSGRGPALEGTERYAADVATPEGARDAVAGAAVVYHCVNVGYHLQVEVMPKIQEAVLDAAEAEGARLVVLDTLYPYGETHGAVMTEDTPWNATTRKGRMRAELDARYLAAHRGGSPSSSGAPPTSSGPESSTPRSAGPSSRPRSPGSPSAALGDIDLPHSYTYIDDVAVSLATLGEHPDADGRVWHLPTAPARTTREILALVEQRTGRTVDVTVVAEPRPFGPFDETFMAEYAEMFYQHTEPQILDSSAVEKAYGLTPTPLETALDATLTWYGEFLAAQR